MKANDILYDIDGIKNAGNFIDNEEGHAEKGGIMTQFQTPITKKVNKIVPSI